MINSMTGFGTGASKDGLIVEVKSVNHRFKEISVKMPRNVLQIEDRIKASIASEVARGKIEVHVTVDDARVLPQQMDVNWLLLDQLVEQVVRGKERYGLTEAISLQALFQHDGVLVTNDRSDRDKEQFAESLFAALKEAIAHMLSMRRLEGSRLSKDINERIDAITVVIEQMETLVPEASRTYEAKLRARLVELLETEEGKRAEERLQIEVSLLTEKHDVTEELVRINSHLALFKETLLSEEPVGRKLDFITQELHREVNTIGSKSHLFSIAEAVILIKSELEKIKEQVQNIE
ncbi:YicC/YloC family endoribonuclease [Aureibacillus halotolerans]|uniref:Uncharacterized protein (TIGR00255 family) n=1 Tax=Aureibacillus halotolerans TaxID=1508390 RepID=A0A4R6UBC9_9BACI|nr:YicC/YloC family endoribonuclease [Aureibacillus halotolerans]TDQ42363.1 uncharacterized protein (TIGR00255 family) [Aureibacillus halotolerans]